MQLIDPRTLSVPTLQHARRLRAGPTGKMRVELEQYAGPQLLHASIYMHVKCSLIKSNLKGAKFWVCTDIGMSHIRANFEG